MNIEEVAATNSETIYTKQIVFHGNPKSRIQRETHEVSLEKQK